MRRRWEELLGDPPSIQVPPPHSLPGRVYTQWGYTSTSTGANAAFSSKPVQLKIRAPRGTMASWVEPYTSCHGEREVLLARGQQFYVHAVYQDPNTGQWVVEIEILPADVDPADLVGEAVSPSSNPYSAT
ncbi:ADP-ribosyltransferase [Cellulomonas composti]|uniref:ADP ribosyltransferase domain-containing protein n=1 Tax=Cellulomonas composti TaxID=266130 RepID=A0A511J8W5_9CELL|nr:ADP-ribosyltransferase [Cellulomonas composti]GEL94149.1 hypothetical protein CCO02nite_08070 [Cellulomonas composti]